MSSFDGPKFELLIGETLKFSSISGDERSIKPQMNARVIGDLTSKSTRFEIEIWNLGPDQLNEIKEEIKVILKFGYRDSQFDIILNGIINKVDYGRARYSPDEKINVFGIDDTHYQLLNYFPNTNFQQPPKLSEIFKKIIKDAELTFTPSIRDDYTFEESIHFDGRQNGVECLDEICKKTGTKWAIIGTELIQGKTLYNDESEFKLDRVTGRIDLKKLDLPGDIEGYKFSMFGKTDLNPGDIIEINLERDPLKEKDFQPFKVIYVEHTWGGTGTWQSKWNVAFMTTGYAIGKEDEGYLPGHIDHLIKQIEELIILHSEKNYLMDNSELEEIRSIDGEIDFIHGTEKYYMDNDYNLKEEKKTIFHSAIKEGSISDLKCTNKYYCSPFTGNKEGLIFPYKPGMRFLSLFRLRNEVFMGPAVWKEGEIPDHEEGDFLLTLLANTNKYWKWLVDKNGNEAKQSNSIKIFIGDTFLAEARPSPTSNNTLEIEHKSGTVISIDENGDIDIIGTGAVNIETTGSVDIKGSDTTIQDGTIEPSLKTHYHQVNALPGPPQSNLPPTTGNAVNTKIG